MNTRKWLERAKNIDEDIKALEQAKNDAISKAIYQSPTFEEVVSMTKDNSNEQKNIAYSNFMDKLEKLQKKNFEIKAEILSAISELEDNRERAILTDFFVNNKPAITIADEKNCDLSVVYRKINSGIRNLEKLQRNAKDCKEKPRFANNKCDII